MTLYPEELDGRLEMKLYMSAYVRKLIVVPAEAGTQSNRSVARPWVPACAGTTDNGLILIKSFSVRLLS